MQRPRDIRVQRDLRGVYGTLQLRAKMARMCYWGCLSIGFVQTHKPRRLIPLGRGHRVGYDPFESSLRWQARTIQDQRSDCVDRDRAWDRVDWRGLVRREA